MQENQSQMSTVNSEQSTVSTTTPSTVHRSPNSFLVILLSILLLISCIIAGFFAYQTQKLVVEVTGYREQLKQTPTSTASVEPTNTSTSELGKVIGKICYPSEFLPQGEIVAKDIKTGKIYSQKYIGSLNGGSENFTFELPIGTYYLRYQAHADGKNLNSYTSFYHTACTSNNDYVFCQSDNNHKIIKTLINKNITTSDVMLCDSGTTQTQEQSLNDSF